MTIRELLVSLNIHDYEYNCPQHYADDLFDYQEQKYCPGFCEYCYSNIITEKDIDKIKNQLLDYIKEYQNE